ncbi:hypothetical protein Q6346_00175 [Isoptericola sp. b490]|nr:O-methyltransferase [Isoptericola sp. b490]MDO8119723.1 hypothetical protein [Isoptericola sp. b490]
MATLRRLQALADLSSYSYVGFGAYQFLDFDLVHRQLGIDRMTSIESDEGILARCHFNAPYKTVDVISGTATTVIPTLDWAQKTVAWLDYTQRLRTAEMSDCENVALRMSPGSVLAVTLNCHPGPDGERRQQLAEAVGEENVPVGTSEARLGEWGLAKIQREILTGLMHRTLSARGDGTAWEQLLNIYYRDGARMQMIVGIVDHPSIHDSLGACRFGDMPEISPDAEPLVVEIPTLTVRERQALGRKLPARALKSFAGLSEGEVMAYAKFYRWLDSVC